MNNYNLYSVLSLLFAAFYTQAQVSTDSIRTSASVAGKAVTGNHEISFRQETREIFRRKGDFFFYWGYNRSAYTKSDIHFWGEGYDFSIADVEAQDEPTTTFLKYITPNAITVPQYNYRLGYFLNDKNFVSLGEDHMKYVMEKQATRLTGTISSGDNSGTYDDEEVLVGEGEEGEPSILDSLPKGFVSGFEHCNGLNDAAIEFGRIEQIWISGNRKHALTFAGAAGPGLVFPDTDADVLGQDAYHSQDKLTYHLAGYSFSASIELQFDFFKYFFLLAKLKSGYMNLSDLHTTIDGGKASQHFSFIEPMLVAGFTHSFGKY